MNDAIRLFIAIVGGYAAGYMFGRYVFPAIHRAIYKR